MLSAQVLASMIPREILALGAAEWGLVALSFVVIALLAMLTTCRCRHRQADLLIGKSAHHHNRMRLILDQMPAMLWSVDRQFRFASIEGAGMAALGPTAAGMVGKTIYEYFGTRDRAYRPIAGHEDAIQHGLSSHYEVQWLDHTYLVHVEPLKDPGGQVIGAIGACIDITDRKRAEQALAETEARTRALLEAIPDVMLRLGADGRLVGVIDHFAAPPHLAKVGTIAQMFPPEVADQLQQGVHRALQTQQAQVFEYLHCSNGQSRYHEARIVAHGPDEALVILRNITQRKHVELELARREAELRALVRSLPDMIFQLTPDGRFAGCVAPHSEQLLAEPEQFLGRHYAQVLPPHVADLVTRHTQLARQNEQQQVFTYPLEIGGEERCYEARLTCDPSQIIILVRSIPAESAAPSSPPHV